MAEEILGYRPLPPEDVERINAVKQLGLLVQEKINELSLDAQNDQRWVAIARTDLQKGFMALARAIAKPAGF